MGLNAGENAGGSIVHGNTVRKANSRRDLNEFGVFWKTSAPYRRFVKPWNDPGAAVFSKNRLLKP